LANHHTSRNWGNCNAETPLNPSARENGVLRNQAGTDRFTGPARFAALFGPVEPKWFVFPWCRRIRPVDPTRPVTSLKRAWDGVREKAGVDCRLHDLRHSFCTKLAEAGVGESVMLDLMGHMSAAMLRRYSHIRAEARRSAITALETGNLVGVVKDSAKVNGSGSLESPVTH
jgi:hypothetical protein